MDTNEMLRAAIKASGKSARRFARENLVRDERVIRRWLAGGSMPKAVAGYLTEYLNGAHAPTTPHGGASKGDL